MSHTALLTLAMLFAIPLLSSVSAASKGEAGVVLPMRDRAAVVDRLLRLRLDRLVPELMRANDLDMWIVIGREYDEDPVLRTMLPATWLGARRRTILVFNDPGQDGAIERLAVARYEVGDVFEAAWNPDEQPDQWARLAEMIIERDPQRIGVNVSETFAHADGLAHSQHEALVAALPSGMRDRLVSAEPVAVGWLERRIPEELDVYASICRVAHEIMAEALSAQVIQPGVTTTDDVKWWCRERIRELGLVAWFHPLVSVQRPGTAEDLLDMVTGTADVIQRGDLIHLDLGVTYLRLNTDTQQMAYVLRRGEQEPPAGLVRAWERGLEMQDILIAEFAEGRTGNEVLKATLDSARSRGIDAMVYSHPIGVHGHAAGPPIGMWDKQGGVPGAGDLPIHDRTCYAIELSINVPVAEWDGQSVRIMMEEDAVFEGGRVQYLDGRQTKLHLVR